MPRNASMEINLSIYPATEEDDKPASVYDAALILSPDMLKNHDMDYILQTILRPKMEAVRDYWVNSGL